MKIIITLCARDRPTEAVKSISRKIKGIQDKIIRILTHLAERGRHVIKNHLCASNKPKQ